MAYVMGSQQHTCIPEQLKSLWVIPSRDQLCKPCKARCHGIVSCLLQAVLVTGEDVLHSHRDFQPCQLPLFLEAALEPCCGLHLLSGVWTAEVLGGKWNHSVSILSVLGTPSPAPHLGKMEAIYCISIALQRALCKRGCTGRSL